MTAPCGHTELTLECECGQRVAAWWAETKRRLAEASPSLRAVFGDQDGQDGQHVSMASDQVVAYQDLRESPVV